jgi:hypothetical protein
VATRVFKAGGGGLPVATHLGEQRLPGRNGERAGHSCTGSTRRYCISCSAGTANERHVQARHARRHHEGVLARSRERLRGGFGRLGDGSPKHDDRANHHRCADAEPAAT